MVWLCGNWTGCLDPRFCGYHRRPRKAKNEYVRFVPKKKTEYSAIARFGEWWGVVTPLSRNGANDLVLITAGSDLRWIFKNQILETVTK